MALLAAASGGDDPQGVRRHHHAAGTPEAFRHNAVLLDAHGLLEQEQRTQVVLAVKVAELSPRRLWMRRR